MRRFIRLTNFARALRSIFRQDPDIVMVGEIRDLETGEIAVKAALTGHLVFSTLHTNDAASAFIRMIDLGLKPFLVASSVRAILGQRLVRTICSTCKEPYKPTEEEVARLGIPGVDPYKVDLFRGAGCDICNHTGYTGRLGCYELLENSDELRKMLLAHSSAIEVRRAARLAGMVTMREDAWRKAVLGITTIDEVNKRTKRDVPIHRNRPATAATRA
ncbi:MAG: ATPase, T2SS/T4P/T4SS family [Candidatus Hydrogenedentes bacterium]|nr:ATPase, T2SS/T4P/T4SS family [Candidatus Hydrogenedentota bacterium]